MEEEFDLLQTPNANDYLDIQNFLPDIQEEAKFYKTTKRKSSGSSKRSSSYNMGIPATYKGQDITSELMLKIFEPYFGGGYFINTPEGRKKWSAETGGKPVPSGLGKKFGEPIDCSGFSRTFCLMFGYDIGEGTVNQLKKLQNRAIKREHVKPGDLVYFAPRGGIRHVGVIYGYDEKGRLLMIDSSRGNSITGTGSGIGIRYVDQPGREITGFYRVFGDIPKALLGGKLNIFKLIPRKRYIK